MEGAPQTKRPLADAPHSAAEMAANLRRVCTLPRLRDWVALAKPGARQIYAAGMHVSAAAEGVPKYLLEMADRGFVILVQKRHADRPEAQRFDYIAIRTRREFRNAEVVALKPLAKAGPPATLEEQVAATFNRAGSRAGKA